ncbi:MAG: variant-type mycofactocin precursor [candidate division WOR-3 bacterium]
MKMFVENQYGTTKKEPNNMEDLQISLKQEESKDKICQIDEIKIEELAIDGICGVY